MKPTKLTTMGGIKKATQKVVTAKNAETALGILAILGTAAAATLELMKAVKKK